jgi:hypothetical protein
MTWVNTFLTSCADETGGDLAIVDGHFFLADEEIDLTGAGVLHAGDEVFAGAQIVLGRNVCGFGRLGSRNGAGRTQGSNRDARRDCGHRGGRAGLLEEHSPADFFHYSSLRVLRLSVDLPTSDEIVVKNLCTSQDRAEMLEIGRHCLHVRDQGDEVNVTTLGTIVTQWQS